MIQHLLSRYGQKGLDQLIRDEVTPQSDGASIISSAAQSSVLSDDASSVWDTQSVRTFSSDTSSITGSIISNVSRGAKFLTRRSTASSTATATPTPAPATIQHVPVEQQESSSASSRDGHDSVSQSTSTPEATASSAASKSKGAFMCGFCKEEDIPKTCTRKNDLKRHIEDFHNANAQWICKHRSCKMVFDWQAAYKAHLKSAHGGSRMSLDEAKVNLCPQVVFACGFENCSQVYEAQSDDDANTVFKDYVAHVVKHFDEGSNSGEWSYSARIRNLLRQSQVMAAWNEASAWNERARSLEWNPHTSVVLRKRLESRHIGDIKMLIQNAMILGSEPNVHPKFREDFITPISDTCRHNMPGHKTRQQAMTPQDSADPFSFRISRGANPQLAQYMATQRKVYVPSRQRVARPPQLHQARSSTNPLMGHAHMPGQHPHGHPPQQHPSQHPHQQPGRTGAGHFFAQMPEPSPQSPMYHQDPNAGQFGANGGGVMHQNGIISDDMQSLRSMASGSPEPADVDMQDPAAMMDFSTPYSMHPGMQTTTTPSMNEQTMHSTQYY